MQRRLREAGGRLSWFRRTRTGVAGAGRAARVLAARTRGEGRARTGAQDGAREGAGAHVACTTSNSLGSLRGPTC